MSKTSIDYAEEWEQHKKCRKFKLTGYRIVKTIDESGNKLNRPIVIAATDDLSKHPEALAIASQKRKFFYENNKAVMKPWVVVANIYSCGHIIY